LLIDTHKPFPFDTLKPNNKESFQQAFKNISDYERKVHQRTIVEDKEGFRKSDISSRYFS